MSTPAARSLRLFALLSGAVLAAADCPSIWSEARQTLSNRDYQPAILQLQLASVQCPAHPDILLDLAKAYLLSNKLTEAQDTLHSLLLLSAHSSAAWKLKGDAHYLSGQDEEAVRAFEQAIRLEPGNEEAVYALGRLYYQQSRPEQAIVQFKRALALNPASHRAHDNLALSLQALNQNEEALRHYLAAIELVHKNHPEYDWVYANLADFLMKQGDNRRAFDLAVEAAQRNPGSGRNCYLAAKALFRLEKSDLSVRWLLRAIELEPGYPEPHYLLGLIYRNRGKSGEAASEFGRFRVLREKAPGKLR